MKTLTTITLLFLLPLTAYPSNNYKLPEEIITLLEAINTPDFLNNSHIIPTYHDHFASIKALSTTDINLPQTNNFNTQSASIAAIATAILTIFLTYLSFEEQLNLFPLIAPILPPVPGVAGQAR